MGRQTLLEALAERESMFRMLPQTTPENTSKNFGAYTVDPVCRKGWTSYGWVDSQKFGNWNRLGIYSK